MSKLLLVPAVLALTACSSGDDTSSEPTSTSADPVPAVEAAVRSYTEAFGAGDTTAVMALVSQRCLAAEGSNAFRDAVAQAHEQYDHLDVTSISTQVQGRTATVSYSVSEASLSQTDQRWVDENGWKWDAC